MDNINVITLKALAKQRVIKGYNKLRKAEWVQKVEAHPDQVLILGLEIPRNTTKSVNTIASFDEPILDEPIVDDSSPTPKIKDFKN